MIRIRLVSLPKMSIELLHIFYYYFQALVLVYPYIRFLYAQTNLNLSKLVAEAETQKPTLYLVC